MRKSLLLVLCAAANVANAKPKVAVCSTDMNAARTSLVAALNATGAFETIAVNTPVDCMNSTPLLKDLKGYDAVLTWSYNSWGSADIGTNLAAYVDDDLGGREHGVVELSNNFAKPGVGFDSPLAGNWFSGGYSCINVGNGTGMEFGKKKDVDLLSADLSSALTEKISALGSYYVGLGGLATGATSVLNYADNTPAIAYCGKAGHRRVALNYYPNPVTGNWVSGDYVTPITNALLYVSGGSMPLKGVATTVEKVAQNAVSDPITVTYTNQGGQPLTITAATLTNSADFSILEQPTLPLSVPANGTAQFKLQFKPTAIGTFTTTLKLTVVDKHTAAEVVLVGQGVKSAIEIQPMPIHLGGCPVGKSKTKDIVITNIGQAMIKIGAASLSGAAFEIVGQPALPALMQSGDSLTVTLKLTPANGLNRGTLTLSGIDFDATTKNNYPIDGYGGAPQFALDAQSVGFGSVDVGASSTQTVNLINDGDGDLLITMMDLQAVGFAIKPTMIPIIEAHRSVLLAITFAPMKAGPHSGTIQFDSNAGSKTIMLSGKGLLGVLNAAPTSLGFGHVRVGKQSAPQEVTLSNSGAGSLVVKSITVSLGFLQVSGPPLPQTLKPNDKIIYGIACTPTAFAPATGAIVDIDASIGKSQVTLDCLGRGPMLLVPPLVDWGLVPINTPSNRTVTLLNDGNDDLKVSSIHVAPKDFSLVAVPPLPFLVKAGEFQNIQVTFHPKMKGPATDQIAIDSDDLTHPAVAIPLQGTGFEVKVDPGTVDAGQVAVGLSGMKSIMISNTAELPVVLVPTIVGLGASQFMLDRAGPLLIAAGKEALLGVIFTPNAEGPAPTTTLLLKDDQFKLAVSVSLKGTGTTPPLTVSRDRIDFGMWPIHSSSRPEKVTMTNLGSEPLTIADIVSIDPKQKQFSIDKTATAMVLGQHETTQFSVSFHANVRGPANQQIQVRIQGLPLMATVSVEGVGGAPAGCSCSVGSRGGLRGQGILALLVALLALRRFSGRPSLSRPSVRR